MIYTTEHGMRIGQDENGDRFVLGRRGKHIPLMNHKRAAADLLEVHAVLNRMSIPFFLIQGTALGAYRDNGFCLTERDIDLGFLAEYLLPRIDELAEELKKVGCNCQVISKPFTSKRLIKVNGPQGTHIDLISYAEQMFRGNRLRYCQATNLDYAVVFPAYIVEEVRSIVFLNQQFWLPSDTEVYLSLEYGEWQTPRYDSVSLCRVPSFFKRQKIKPDSLERYE